MPELTFTSGDVAAASQVLIASAEALAARGEPLWPPASLTPERLARHYPPEGWRVAWPGGAGTGAEAVGCYVLLDRDPLFWPDDPPGEALYLHKLAVRPAAQGQGLAGALLGDAAAQARAAGRGWLRLDTASDRPKLRALYIGAGFVAVDEVQVGAYHVVRFGLRLD
jgi:GNAT superfamily N-acetyltransferase